MIPNNLDKAGWLSYGPSVPLPESKYRYTFEYSSLELSSQVIGKWDVVLDGAIQLASGQLIGTEGKKRIIEGIVHVTPQNA